MALDSCDFSIRGRTVNIMVSIKLGDCSLVWSNYTRCKQPGVVTLTWVVHNENVREHSVVIAIPTCWEIFLQLSTKLNVKGLSHPTNGHILNYNGI